MTPPGPSDLPGPGAPARPAGDGRAIAAAAAAVVLLGLFAYSSSLRGDFVFDDLRQVRDNAALRDLGGFLPWSGAPGPLPNRWAGYLTFALNRRLLGPEPAGFHAVNLAIHLAGALLVLALVVLAFRTPRLRGSALAVHSGAVGFAAAALFATHPLGTQAVTYVVQRLTSQATLLYLLAVVLYLAWRLGREAAERRPAREAATYAALLVASLLALRTKEIAFTLPLALALAEACFFPPGGWRRFAPIAPVAAMALLVPLSLVRVGAPVAEILADAGAATKVQTALGRAEYARTQAVVVADYLRLLVLPTGQSLDHDVPVVASLLEPRAAASLSVLALLAGLAAALAIATRARPGRPGPDPALGLVSFGIAWFFLTLLVESSFIPIVDLMNEHRAYLPSAGLLVAAATGLALALRRLVPRTFPRATVLTAALLALVLAAATLRRNAVWASEITLWADAAEKAPAKFRPWFNLGTALAARGHLGEAAAALRRAAQIDPSSAPASAQLGAALLQVGRTGEAEPALRRALELERDDPEALMNLAQTLWRMGRKDEARPLYARFLEVAPTSYAAARQIARSRATPPAAAPAAPAAGPEVAPDPTR